MYSNNNHKGFFGVGEKMMGVDSISCSISGNTLFHWYSVLHLPTFSHGLNSSSRNCWFSNTKEYTHVSGEHSKWRQRFRFRSLCISWQLWDHLASLLIVTHVTNWRYCLITKTSRFFDHLPLAVTSVLVFCPTLGSPGISRDVQIFTHFHPSALPSFLILPYTLSTH